MFKEYEPGSYIQWIVPTPLRMVVARGDHLTLAELAIAAFERAREPKDLVILPGGHFDASWPASTRPAVPPATGSWSTCWRGSRRGWCGCRPVGDQVDAANLPAARVHVARLSAG